LRSSSPWSNSFPTALFRHFILSGPNLKSKSDKLAFIPSLIILSVKAIMATPQSQPFP